MSKIVPIVQIDDSNENPLRGDASFVMPQEFGTQELKELTQTMRATLAEEDDGVALAAPQIGIRKRIFVVSPLAYKEDTKWKPLVFINPKIIKTDKKKYEMEEGCLSVRWIYGKTKRFAHVTVEAYDENGEKFTYGASGLIAHIFQHEIDHLHGILFTDHGYDLEEYSEEEVRSAIAKKK